MSTRYDMTARERELLMSARTQLNAIISVPSLVTHATGFAKEVEKIVADIERLLGY